DPRIACELMAAIGEGVLVEAHQRPDVERHPEAPRKAELLIEDELWTQRPVALAEKLRRGPRRRVDRRDHRQADRILRGVEQPHLRVNAEIADELSAEAERIVVVAAVG